MSIPCQMCGTENRDGRRYCSACGNALTNAVPDLPPATIPTSPQHFEEVSKSTMVGIQSNEAIKGIPMIRISGAPPSPTEKAASAEGPQSRTVIGMKAVTPPNPAPKPASIPIAKPVELAAQDISPTYGENPRSGTAIGMKAPSLSGKKELNKTPVEIPTSAALAQAVSRVRAAHVANTPVDLDEIGVGELVPAKDAPILKQEESLQIRKSFPVLEASSSEVDTGDFEDPREEQPKSRGMTIAVAVASAVALVAVGVVVFLSLSNTSSVLRPTLVSSGDGKSVTVSLSFPEAPLGTTIQAMGVRISVVGAKANINIPIAALKLGTNDIGLLYQEPGKDPRQMSFPIMLRHTVTDDFSGLAAEKPFFTVVFQSAPGVRLDIAGKPVQNSGPAQNAGNTYFHKVTLGETPESITASGGVRLYKIPFQLIDETGAVEQGVHVTAVPVSKLRLDHPSSSAVVVSDSITCSGSTEEGAQVTVNGQPVTVIRGAFNTTLPLGGPGEYPISVVARAPGKAPYRVDAKVTRIVSFAPLVDEWSKDLDPSFDYPTVAGSPGTQVGKKIRLTGRVVNISTEKGVTAFILYVGKGCPAHSKCAVYVVFRSETDAALHSWVDVLGKVRGTRAVEMQNGIKIDVPAVDAAFVLPAENAVPLKSKQSKLDS